METEAGEEDAGLKALVALLKAKYHAYQGDYIKAEQVLKPTLELLATKVGEEEETECPIRFLRHKIIYSLIKGCFRMRQFT